jgi:hypothetical protein
MAMSSNGYKYIQIDEGSSAIFRSKNNSCLLRTLVDHRAQTGHRIIGNIQVHDNIIVKVDTSLLRLAIMATGAIKITRCINDDREKDENRVS